MARSALALLWLTCCIAIRADAACDPRLPHCKGQAPQAGRRQDCKPIWLIPGKATDCSKPTSKKLINIDPNSVTITPNPIKLPGCFTITMKSTLRNVDIPWNFFGHVRFDMPQVPTLSHMQCQNASGDGCGGYGNNCYYCDICNSFREIDRTNTQSNLVSQFKGMSCPDKSGYYEIKRQFCFNDWAELDKDNDCKIDALENEKLGHGYSDVLKKISRNGATVNAKFTLAHNATQQQAALKTKKEAEIVTAVSKQLEAKRQENNWALDSQQYQVYRNWYLQDRLNKWNRDKFKPWLLFTNECGCLSVSFDVCSEKPVGAASGPNAYQCG